MKLGKRHGRTLPRRFRHLLLQLARQSQRDVERIPRHHTRAIHALRIRMKKLSAIVHLVEARMPARSRRAILASTKQLKKAFASERDAQVAAELGFSAKAPVKSPAALSLLDETARLVRLIEAEDLEGLTRKEVRRSYVKTYRAGRKCMKTCLDDPDPALLHAWRKPVKEHYYQSLVLRRLPGMTRRLRRARKLARWLGQDHDWQLVIDYQPDAAPRIEPERNRFRRRIFKLAPKLFSVRPGKFARALA